LRSKMRPKNEKASRTLKQTPPPAAYANRYSRFIRQSPKSALGMPARSAWLNAQARSAWEFRKRNSTLSTHLQPRMQTLFSNPKARTKVRLRYADAERMAERASAFSLGVSQAKLHSIDLLTAAYATAFFKPEGRG
jgi:hypothetical protein